MDKQQLAQQPNLNLTEEQKQIILAHVVESGRQLLEMRFTQDRMTDTALSHAYHSGQREAYTALLEYDAAKAATLEALSREEDSTTDE